jgi:hypothetical protein
MLRASRTGRDASILTSIQAGHESKHDRPKRDNEDGRKGSPRRHRATKTLDYIEPMWLDNDRHDHDHDGNTHPNAEIDYYVISSLSTVVNARF